MNFLIGIGLFLYGFFKWANGLDHKKDELYVTQMLVGIIAILSNY